LAIVLLIIELALLTEYFAFPDVKAVLQDLCEMKPKMLSDVELDAIVWASVKSSSSFVITVISDARALVADTRSILMQCSAVNFRWGAGVLIPIIQPLPGVS
jgi:hypothetical protein